MTAKRRFSKSNQQLTEYARGLSSPAKIAILKKLARQDSCVCGEIVGITPLAQSTVSQHLKELKELGLIAGTVQGAKSCYCLDQRGLHRCVRLLNIFFEALKSDNKDCNSNSCKPAGRVRRRPKSTAPK